MPDLANADHDLLIRIDTKLDYFKQDLDHLRSSVRADFNELAKRVSELEADFSHATGFVSGGKFFWALITAIPAGAVAFLLGYTT